MEVGHDMKVPSSEYDGKVVYGEKRKSTGTVTAMAFRLGKAEYCKLCNVPRM